MRESEETPAPDGDEVNGSVSGDTAAALSSLLMSGVTFAEGTSDAPSAGEGVCAVTCRRMVIDSRAHRSWWRGDALLDVPVARGGHSQVRLARPCCRQTALCCITSRRFAGCNVSSTFLSTVSDG